MNSFLHGSKYTTGNVAGGLLLGYWGLNRRQPVKWILKTFLYSILFSMGI